MNKKNLQVMAGISWASVTKPSNGEAVSIEVLMKICKSLTYDVGNNIELFREGNKACG